MTSHLSGIEAVEREMVNDPAKGNLEHYAARLKAERERIEPFLAAAEELVDYQCSTDGALDLTSRMDKLIAAYRAMRDAGKEGT